MCCECRTGGLLNLSCAYQVVSTSLSFRIGSQFLNCGHSLAITLGQTEVVGCGDSSGPVERKTSALRVRGMEVPQGLGSRAGEWPTQSLWHLPHPRQEADGQGHGQPPHHFTDTSTVDDNHGRMKRNGKREGGPENNAISGKMQKKREMLRHGVRKQREPWGDTEMVSENGQMW